MNELIHIFTGYFIALVWLNSKMKTQNAFQTHKWILILTGIAALLPDLAEGFTPTFGHGTWTHTILGASMCAIFFTLFVYSICKQQITLHQITGRQFFFLNWIAAMSHLVLDIVTHQQFRCVEASADFKHIYFWPVWNQSFHLDCLFGWTYLTRALLEWAVYIPIITIWLIIRWRKFQENPLQIFNPRLWSVGVIKEAVVDAEKTIKHERIKMIIVVYFLPVFYVLQLLI